MTKFRCMPLLILLIFLSSSCAMNKNISAMVEKAPNVTTTTTSTPTPQPYTPPTPSYQPKTVASILSAGDVIMHDAVIQSGKCENEIYDYSSIFKLIKPYTENADYSVISYEGVSLETDKNYTGYPLFNAPPSIMSAFSYAGFDMVNNGNNHCLDRSLEGLLETRNIIKQQNMQVIGTFQDAAAPRYKIQDIHGIKVGFLSYTYGCNMNENRLSEEERDIYLSLIDNERIKEELTTLEPMVDIVIVLVHWGVEYRQSPTDSQKELADNMLLWGADIILGSHPHVVEPSEIREVNGETKYIIYSMGNFLSNQIGGNNPNPRNNDLTEDGMMIQLEIEKDYEKKETSLISVTHIPTWVYRYKENGDYHYTIYPVPSPDHDSLQELDANLVEKLKNSYNRTMKLVRDFPYEP